MRILIFFRKIFLISLAICVGYFTLMLSLGDEGFEIVNKGISKDIILRRNFIVHTLSKKTSPQHFFESGESQFAGEWTLVTFSMAAAALTNIAMQSPDTAYESSQLIAKMIDASLSDDVANFDTVAWLEHPLEDEILKGDEGHIGYYGHLNIMLGCYALLNSDGRFKETHLKISNAIARRMKKYPHRHVQTYPNETYPPDNTVSVASLRIADMTLNTNYAPLIKEWIEQSKRLEDPDTGLIVFQIDINTGEALQPSRGSHVGWNSFYLPIVDEDYAAIQYGRFKKHLLRRFLGFSAFKEYPKGKLFYVDRDAGPVIFGVGFASTGFAVAGARRSGDAVLLSGLLRFIELFGVSGKKGNHKRYMASPIVGDAIMLAMKTACPWRAIGKKGND